MQKNPAPHGIDLTAPGGLLELFAFHRATFGDAVMEADPAGAPDPAGTPGTPPADPAPAPGDPAGDEELRPEGIKALRATREELANARAEALRLKKIVDDAEAAKLSDIDRANKQAQDVATENAKLKTELGRLTAIADHQVPPEYQHLVQGADAQALAKSAKDVADLAAKAAGAAPVMRRQLDPVHESGTGGGSNASGGSVAAGRDLYRSKNKQQ